ncbi:hypothetical protein ACPWSR_04650 [Alloiococcus sp. CFN-8]|uniref:hypothetical protein n=1 Tax=Alloiococcus sp. CFN-8 TaxID=3416081 RepID=UPI003CF34F99
MKYLVVIKALALAFGTFILGGIVMGIVLSSNESVNIMQAIYYLAAVVAFWGYLIYKKSYKSQDN